VTGFCVSTFDRTSTIAQQPAQASWGAHASRKKSHEWFGIIQLLPEIYRWRPFYEAKELEVIVFDAVVVVVVVVVVVNQRQFE